MKKMNIKNGFKKLWEKYDVTASFIVGLVLVLLVLLTYVAIYHFIFLNPNNATYFWYLLTIGGLGLFLYVYLHYTIER